MNSQEWKAERFSDGWAVRLPDGDTIERSVGGALREDEAHLIAAAPELREELAKLQWSFAGGCPVCSREPSQGHAPECSLGAALKKATTQSCDWEEGIAP